MENDIEAAGAKIIYVLQQDRSFIDGTASSCRDFLDSLGSTTGICVGDGETEPWAKTFQNSPFTINRGFDAIVTRSDMKIVFQTSHGTPEGNENITGADVLAAVQEWTSQ